MKGINIKANAKYIIKSFSSGYPRKAIESVFHQSYFFLVLVEYILHFRHCSSCQNGKSGNFKEKKNLMLDKKKKINL